MNTPAEATHPRLQQLLGFLDQDPTNLPLLGETASAAFDQGELGQASALLERYSQLAPLPPQLLNLRGLIALDGQNFSEAAKVFAAVAEQGGQTDPAVRFNLAWAKTMLGEHEAALELMNDEVSRLSARAAALRVQLLHHAELLEEALEFGAAAAEIYADESPLMGALASVAVDAERPDLAQYYGERAGSNPDGISALGLLMLDDDKVEQSIAQFDRALERQPTNARALLGKGLALLRDGRAEMGAELLDQAALEFGDHLGSWIAAGWAYYVRGDLETSRTRFETALAIDDTFAEIHGGLAVLDFAAGDLESARRRSKVALQLDRQCFAGVLAQSMLLEREGRADAARKIREAALTTPLGASGRTIAAALSRAGVR